LNRLVPSGNVVHGDQFNNVATHNYNNNSADDTKQKENHKRKLVEINSDTEQKKEKINVDDSESEKEIINEDGESEKVGTVFNFKNAPGKKNAAKMKNEEIEEKKTKTKKTKTKKK